MISLSGACKMIRHLCVNERITFPHFIFSRFFYHGLKMKTDFKKVEFTEMTGFDQYC